MAPQNGPWSRQKNLKLKKFKKLKKRVERLAFSVQGGQFTNNKKVLLRERKRHTARRVASPGSGYLPWLGAGGYPPWPGGTYPPWLAGVYLGGGYPPWLGGTYLGQGCTRHTPGKHYLPAFRWKCGW